MNKIHYDVVGKELSQVPEIENVDEAIEAVRKLLDRPWFKRLWVVQEIANSRRIQMCCVRHSFDWNTWSLVQQAVRSLDHPICQGISQLISTGCVARLVTERQNTKSYWRSLGFEVVTPLLRLLDLYRNWESTHPRDKVFATKNLMSNDANMPLPLADYNASVRSIYCHVAHASIRYHHDLNILCMPHTGNGGGEHNLPSWMTDWSRPATSSNELRKVYRGTSKTFGAGGGIHPSGPSIEIEPGTTCKVCNAPYDVARFRESMDIDFRFNSEDADDDGLVRRPVKAGGWKEEGSEMLWVDGVKCGKIELHETILDTTNITLEELRDVLLIWYREIRTCLPSKHALVLDGAEEQAAFSFFHLLTNNKTVLTMDGPVKAHRSIARLILKILTADEDVMSIPNAFSIAMDIIKSIRGYTFAWLERGQECLPAMVPNTAQSGDGVAVIFGCRLPLVLRPTVQSGNTEHQVMGVVHCPGIMEGEVLAELGDGRCTSRTFVLV